MHRVAAAVVVLACLLVAPSSAAAFPGWGPSNAPGAPGLGDPYFRMTATAAMTSAITT